jgi:hypothetical protein
MSTANSIEWKTYSDIMDYRLKEHKSDVSKLFYLKSKLSSKAAAYDKTYKTLLEQKIKELTCNNQS